MMLANQKTCPVKDAYNTLNDLDEHLYHIQGAVAALDLLAEDLGLSADSSATSAFWAIMASAEVFIERGLACSNSLHGMMEGRSNE